MDFTRAFSQLADLYRSMTPGSRLTAGLLAAVAAGALAFLCTGPATAPDADLMHGVPVAPSQLPVMQAAFAKAKLKSPLVRGTSILVPRGEESQYMQALVAANALPPSLGAARRVVLDGASMIEIGSAREQYRMKMAKLEDLSAAIRQRPGIEIASVDYDVDPRPGPFKDKLATAVVWVKAAGSAQLDEETVLAIRDSVVPAFAGLKPEDVTVSDLNGRTWRGAIGTPEENRYRALKRTAEQELKTRVSNALSHVPSANVQVTVELDRRQAVAGASSSEKDRPAAAPTSVRVLVRVPMSYFTSIWQDRNPAVPDQLARTPDQAAIDQIRDEESGNIRRCVAAVLPPVGSGTSLAEMVTVTPYTEIHATAPALSLRDAALEWAKQSWRPLAGGGIALVCLIGLWLVTRTKPVKPEQPATLAVAEPVDEPTPPKPAAVAAPHWRRPTAAADRPVRQVLSKIVEDDPEAAANILRKWIGQAS